MARSSLAPSLTISPALSRRASLGHTGSEEVDREASPLMAEWHSPRFPGGEGHGHLTNPARRLSSISVGDTGSYNSEKHLLGLSTSTTSSSSSSSSGHGSGNSLASSQARLLPGLPSLATSSRLRTLVCCTLGLAALALTLHVLFDGNISSPLRLASPVPNSGSLDFSDVHPKQYPASLGFDGDALASDIFPALHNMCDVCDCSTQPAALPSGAFTLRNAGDGPQHSDLASLVRKAVLDIQCKHVYSTRNKAFVSLRDIIRNPSSVMTWDLSRLDANKPTAYMFTKTAPVSKVADRRPGYMERHVKTIHAFNEKLQNSTEDGGWESKYEDGTPADARQVLWIIVEDNGRIDDYVAATLAEGNINYIYFALGPTRNFGNAQHNAALSMVHHLSNDKTGMLGHGPIFSADDDAEIHHDLIMYVWRLRRIGIWPMGNLGPTGFEGAIWDENDKIVGWSAGNSWRKYPVDNGAFAFNSTLLGHELPGPAFWPTDTDGGETEFIERVVKQETELEPICRECHIAWHNHPLNIPHVGFNVYRPGR